MSLRGKVFHCVYGCEIVWFDVKERDKHERSCSFTTEDESEETDEKNGDTVADSAYAVVEPDNEVERVFSPQRMVRVRNTGHKYDVEKRKRDAALNRFEVDAVHGALLALNEAVQKIRRDVKILKRQALKRRRPNDD